MNEPFMEPLLRYLRIKKIVKLIPKDSVICDIGCGYNAKFLFSIKDKIERGFGFDQKLEVKSTKKIKLKKVRLDEKIPLPDESVDCVIMLAVLEHLNKPNKIIKEIKRILKCRGKLILTTPSPYAKPVLEFLTYRLGVINEKEMRDHKHYFSTLELKKLCERNDLKVKVCKYFECMMNILVVAKK